MKSLTTYWKFLILAVLVLMSACVNDDSFFPEENIGEITSSIAVVTILDNFDSGTTFLSENEQCFKFVYPINLGYNTDSSIKINNYAGLISVISSQVVNFNITGLQFPVNVVINTNDSEVTIEDETALIEVLRACQFNTIRDDFDTFFNECFRFEYPVTLINSNDRGIVLESDQDFDSFFQNQGAAYQPTIKFPINLLVAPDFNPQSISTYFELYRIINACETRCPELNFTSNLNDPYNLAYTFEAIFPDLTTVGTYSWFIDDEFVEEDGPDNEGDNLLVRNFDAPGEYKICIKTENDTCPEFCENIVVPELCTELFFEVNQDVAGVELTADFEGISNITYQWVVNDQVVEVDGGADGNNRLIPDIGPGTHSVCIRATVPSCPNDNEVLEFCNNEIIVEETCPNLSFGFEPEGNNQYSFFASFEDDDSITYEWIVDDMLQEVDGGSDGDGIFTFQFELAGTYTVCMRAENSSCPSGTEFCEEIVVQ
ncbi:hypothetical protein [Aquimarina sp. RZ0]|uniref:hypothetical protein n=1 Tax=Aquimarina sp. RZ0 TaxID=2607730 RepID=UPI0011F17664|nr:hypothetical protein [Aquimarina sp. RZ0]KAA1246465.1 hypothetical protein F0000_07610 [Aquimarina sp. RZ0]